MSLFTFFLSVSASPRLTADDVQFNLVSHTSTAATNRNVLVTPLALYPPANQAVTYDPVLYNSGSSGAFTISNMTRGLYRADIQAPPARTSFAFFVETNGTGAPLVSVDRLQRATPAEVKTPQDYAYSAQASDARYLSAGALANYTTNGQPQTAPHVAGTNVLWKNSSGVPVLTWNDASLQFEFANPPAMDGAEITNLQSGSLVGTIPLALLPPDQTNALSQALTTRMTVATNDQAAVTAAQLATKLSASGGTGTSNTLLNANIPTDEAWLGVIFDHSWPAILRLAKSGDGISWKTMRDPILSAIDAWTPSGQYACARDGSFFYYNGQLFLSVLLDMAGQRVCILQPTNGYSSWVTNQIFNNAASGRTVVWPARWFTDPNDGVLHLMTFQGTGSLVDFQPFEQHLTNTSDFTSWSTPVQLSGQWWTNTIDTEYSYADGYYNCFYSSGSANGSSTYIVLARATNLLGPWTLVRSNDWAGWGVSYEGPRLFRLKNGNYRLYFSDLGNTEYFSECTSANFPLGPWTAKRRINIDTAGVNDMGMIQVTNLIQQNLLSQAEASLNSHSDCVFYADVNTIFAANCTSRYLPNGTPVAWNELDSINTNLPAMQMAFYHGTAGAGNLPQCDVAYLPKGGRRGGQGWTILGTFKSTGWNGPVVGGTVSGTTITASTLFSGGDYKITSLATSPTVTGTDVVLWNSNKVVYGSSATKTNLIIDLR